jgi:pyruvate kinase
MAPSSSDAFFAGERHLAEHTHELFGISASSRPIALLVTCPSEAAEEPSFIVALAERGVEVLRINYAHDGVDCWERMVQHARAAERATGRRFKILAGPKMRTGNVRLPEDEMRIKKGALLAIVPPGGLDRIDVGELYFAIECSCPKPW